MHFHLPKPLHGWRAFVGEVGIIVIGVLIALGAEQVVEAIHDRQVAEETRASLKGEIEANLGSMQVRAGFEQCIGRRLSEVHAILAQWGRTGSFVTPGLVSTAPGIRIVSVRFDAAASAGRLSLLPSEEQFRIGRLIKGMQAATDAEDREGPAWAQLRLLENGPAILTASDRTQILVAFQNAAYDDYTVRDLLSQIIPYAKTFGYVPNTRATTDTARYIGSKGYRPRICLPIDTSPNDADRITGSRIRMEF